MIGLTLSDIENELRDLADLVEDDWEENAAEKIRNLARRIGVQIEMQALASREAV